MYLSRYDIYSLESFLNWLFIGFFFLNMEVQNREWKKLETFKNYISNTLSSSQQIKDNNFPLRQFLPHEYLLKISWGDEKKALDLFFELFDEFIKEKEIIFEWDEKNI